MRDLYDSAESLFNWYRSVYTDHLYLDGQLQLPAAHPRPDELSPPPAAPEQVRETIIEQGSPELQQYYLDIRDCQKCALGKTRKNFVFGYGNPHARLMFVGEAPGRDEDEQGVPFVGAAGRLLDKMLQAIGLRRDQVYIANVIKCRPPGNRDPQADEIEHCEPYLKQQLAMIKPDILVALGRISGQALLKQESSLSSMRDQVHTYDNIPFIVTYHPAALLRNPRWKSSSWQDLKKIKKLLENHE